MKNNSGLKVAPTNGNNPEMMPALPSPEKHIRHHVRSVKANKQRGRLDLGRAADKRLDILVSVKWALCAT